REARRPARRGARRDRATERGGQARGAQRAPRDRSEEPVQALGGGAGWGRRPGRADGARLSEPGLRGEVRLPLRRLRQPPPEDRDPRRAAAAARADTGGGARHRRRGARRDRGGPMAALLTLDPYATDWLDLLTRWLHVIAGIVWIGA